VNKKTFSRNYALNVKLLDLIAQDTVIFVIAVCTDLITTVLGLTLALELTII